jgi:tetratricopeptide (TPR) repeat protein
MGAGHFHVMRRTSLLLCLLVLALFVHQRAVVAGVPWLPNIFRLLGNRNKGDEQNAGAADGSPGRPPHLNPGKRNGAARKGGGNGWQPDGMVEAEVQAVEQVNELLGRGEHRQAVEKLKKLQVDLAGDVRLPEAVRTYKLARSAGTMGHILCSQAQWKEAEGPLNEALLLLRQERLSFLPPAVRSSFETGLMEDLATSLAGQGKHVAAEKVWRQCVSRRMALGSLAPPNSSMSHPLQLAAVPSQEGLAVALAQQGRFQEAATLSRAALACREQALAGSDALDPQTVPPMVVAGLVRCKAQLATWLMALGKSAEAEGLLVSALEAAAGRKSEVEGRISCSDLLTTLGACLADQGKSREAQEAHWRALSEMKASDTHSGFLPIVLSSLAVSAHEAGHTSASQSGGVGYTAEVMDALLKSSLDKARKSLKPDDPRLALALSHASHAPLHAGRLGDAEALLREALGLTSPSKTNPIRAEVLYKLGLVLCLKGAAEDAEGLLRESLAMYTSPDVNNAPAAGSAMMALAKSLMGQGPARVAEASTLLQKAYDIHSAAFGSGSRQCAALLYLMGCAASLQGRESEAEEMFRQGLQISEGQPRCGGIGANCQIGLASLLMSAGRDDEAMDILRDAISRIGPGHPDATSATLFAARALLKAGRDGEAEDLLQQALANRTVGGPSGRGRFIDGPDVVNSLMLLGKVHQLRDQDKEAEGCMREALAMAQRISGDDCIMAARAMQTLAEVLESIPGKDAEAASLERKAAAILEEHKKTSSGKNSGPDGSS